MMAENTVRRYLILLLLTCLTGVSFIGECLAHDLGLARIQLTRLSDQAVQLEAKLPTKLDPSSPLVTDNCQVSEPEERVHNRLNKTVSWQIICPELTGLTEPVVLDWEREAALVISDTGSGNRIEHLIDSQKGQINLRLDQLLNSQPDGFSLVQRYIGLGIEHILIGLDHLAFLVGLFLIASGWRLVKMVTAFTVGHSLSLAAASTGMITVPVTPTEVVIALSVAFIAREAFLPEEERRHNYLLVVLFGLLHGLGFASVLGEIGVLSENLFLSIVSFNVGVEIGQLIFISSLVVSTSLLKRLNIVLADHARPVTAIALGSVAIFWTLDRVSAFIS